MSSNVSEDDQSEDGELRHSPGLQHEPKHRRLQNVDFSEDDAEAMDALDIKPPQARVAQATKTSKTRSHERHHKRERHRSERHFHREKHHSRDKSLRHAKERHYAMNYEGYVEAQYSYRERGGSRSHAESSRKYEGGKKGSNKSRGDKELHDLRQRLLSKQSGEEYARFHDHEAYERKHRRHGEPMEVALQGEAGVYVREMIDISTGDERKREGPKLSKEERLEQELRRDKLLEAEREMERLKQQSRLERRRRQLEKATERELERMRLAKVNKRKTEEEEDPNFIKRIKNDENVVNVSDNTEESELEEEYEEKRQQSDFSGSSSESKSRESREASPYSENSARRSSRSKSRSATASPVKISNEDEDIEEAKPEEVEEVIEAEPKIDENLPPYFPAIQGCRSVAEFQSLNRIEEGTYGVVYRARDKRTEEIVALKRLKMEKEKEGFPITSLREINTLLKGQHPNIVTVREIVVGSNMDKIYIVMDYVEHDLKSLMETMRRKKQTFMPGEIKCLLKQLLLAVAHLHDNWILHRDLKTSNLLLSHKGILKVGDFGLAREYGSPLKAYTAIVVTLWYRAPELLLCTKEYSTPIDMWSVGCIFAELLLMNPLFPGKSELDQLNRVFKELGTPNERIWTGFNQLPAVKKMKFTEYPVSNLRGKFSTLSEIGLGLLIKFLTFDPAKRVTAEEALTHGYFSEPPLPIDPAMFPTWPAKSELGQKRAAAASPKPPSAGGEFKRLGDDADDSYGFRIAQGLDHRRSGPGFNLKFSL